MLRNIATPAFTIDLFIALVMISGMVCCSYLLTDPHFYITKFMLTSYSDVSFNEYYRFITANFAHFNMQHLLENALAFLIIYFLPKGTFAGLWPVKLIICILLGLITTLSLFYLTDVCSKSMGYAGMSGLLHGLLIYNCLYIYKERKQFIALLIIIGVIIKIFIDMYFPELTFHKLSQDLYGNAFKLQHFIQSMNPRDFRVSYESHIAGSIGGAVLFIITCFSQKFIFRKNYK